MGILLHILHIIFTVHIYAYFIVFQHIRFLAIIIVHELFPYNTASSELIRIQCVTCEHCSWLSPRKLNAPIYVIICILASVYVYTLYNTVRHDVGSTLESKFPKIFILTNYASFVIPYVLLFSIIAYILYLDIFVQS